MVNLPFAGASVIAARNVMDLRGLNDFMDYNVTLPYAYCVPSTGAILLR